jgi:hypothetical protein
LGKRERAFIYLFKVEAVEVQQRKILNKQNKTRSLLSGRAHLIALVFRRVVAGVPARGFERRENRLVLFFGTRVVCACAQPHGKVSRDTGGASTPR